MEPMGIPRNDRDSCVHSELRRLGRTASRPLPMRPSSSPRLRWSVNSGMLSVLSMLCRSWFRGLGAWAKSLCSFKGFRASGLGQ